VGWCYRPDFLVMIGAWSAEIIDPPFAASQLPVAHWHESIADETIAPYFIASCRTPTGSHSKASRCPPSPRVEDSAARAFGDGHDKEPIADHQREGGEAGRSLTTHVGCYTASESSRPDSVGAAVRNSSE